MPDEKVFRVGDKVRDPDLYHRFGIIVWGPSSKGEYAVDYKGYINVWKAETLKHYKTKLKYTCKNCARKKACEI